MKIAVSLRRSQARRRAVLTALLLLAGAAWTSAETLDFEQTGTAAIERITVESRQGNWGIVIQNKIDTEVLFTRSDRDDISVRLTGQVQSNRRRCLPELDAARDGSTLEIGIPTCRGPVAFLRMRGKMTLEVAVPRSWNGDYSVDASSARVSLPDGRLGTVDLEVSSGRIEVGELQADDVTLSVSSGSMELGTVRAQQSRFEASSGGIRVENLRGDVEVDVSSGDVRLGFAGNPGRAYVESSSGTIVIEELDGAAEVETSSGDVRLLFARFTENSRIETSSGDVRVSLPADSSFDLDLSTSSGNLRVEFPVTIRGDMGRDDIEGFVGDGGPELEVETSSGDVRVIES